MPPKFKDVVDQERRDMQRMSTTTNPNISPAVAGPASREAISDPAASTQSSSTDISSRSHKTQTPPPRRQRSRIACEPCRERKRKCDGGEPCSLCDRFGYTCRYRSTPRRRRGGGRQSGRAGSRRSASPAGESTAQSESERTPGDAVSTSLIDPTRAQFVAWNLFLGERRTVSGLSSSPRGIRDIVSLNDMQDLATVYFDNFDPCYSCIDRSCVDQVIEQTWMLRGETTATDNDALLGGIAAIACLFSRLMDLETETNLVNMTKVILDQTSYTARPSVVLATAWLLRTVYLRLTANPDESWLSSCTTLHMIDAAGLHRGSNTDEGVEYRDVRHNIFRVIQYLNLWLSFDLERSPVILQDANILAPPSIPQSGDATDEILGLLPYAEKINPHSTVTIDELRTALSVVLSREHTQPCSILEQVNLALQLCRRLQILRSHMAPAELVIPLLQKGIQAVYTTIESRSPWHHTASILFQSMFVLLAINTPESLSMLAEGTQCLQAVNQAYQTKATRDAVAAAQDLLSMYGRQRQVHVGQGSSPASPYPPETMPEGIFERLQIDQASMNLPWFDEPIEDPDFEMMGGE